MQYLRDISWDEVFDGWRQREASNPGWVEVATKVKGWPDWESWRRHSAEALGAPKRAWKLYRFDNPGEEIPSLLMGPYSGWQSRVPEGRRNAATFGEMLAQPEQYAFWNGHEGVAKIIAGLPFPTDLIGVKRADNGGIVLFDGHHRATAISLATMSENALDWSGTEVRIALTELAAGEERALDEMLQRGSSKQ